MAITIPIVISAIFSAYLISSMEEQNPQEDMSEDQRNEIAWQLLQKTYLEQECREKFLGQSEELKECFDRIEEEQRLNPPIMP